MTTVYADTVLVTNFCLDYILLFLTAKYMNIKIDFFRTFLSATAGAVFALACAFFNDKRLLCLVLSLAFIPVMCAICFGRKNIGTVIKAGVSFFLLSLVLCGTAMFSFLSFYGNITNDRNTFAVTAMSSFLILAFLKLRSRGFFTRANLLNQNVTIIHNGVKAEYKMLCDNANLLVDPYCGYPVIVIKESEKNRIMQEDRVRLMSIVTASGRGLVAVFTPYEVYVKGNRVTASVCFAKDENINICDCDGIIPAILVI